MKSDIDKETMKLGAVIGGILGITIMVCSAHFHGIDGAVHASGVGGVGVMVGYIFKGIKK